MLNYLVKFEFDFFKKEGFSPLPSSSNSLLLFNASTFYLR